MLFHIFACILGLDELQNLQIEPWHTVWTKDLHGSHDHSSHDTITLLALFDRKQLLGI